jgi:CHAT domain-containing protein
VRSAKESFHAQLDALALTADRKSPNLPFLKRAADALLERMYDALIRPLEIEGAPRLTLVPHGFLHRVPFECLRGSDGYLIDRTTVRRSPSADFLLRDRSTSLSANAGGKVVLSGMVDGGPAFVASELETVRNALGRANTISMRDPTAGELLDAFSTARWIHLSTHGVFREDNPLFSRLSTRGGALFLVDLLERRMDAELVVLSACNSGQVFAGEGDDLSGVAHGFLAAGARRLVASTWRVHDQATRDWMEHFYGELARDGSDSGSERRPDPGHALRHASMQTRQAWDHPFYWGAFCLHG